MIFAMGFLAATLVALLVIPAVNARAERLSKRRLEALFPLSISELTAEKDHQRAEFAVLQRRIERQAEEAGSRKHADMEELGRRAVRIEALGTELNARDARIAGLESELAATRDHLKATQDEVAATQAMLGGTRETLAALDAAHRQTLDEFGATRGKLEAANSTLAETRTELAAVRERLDGAVAAFADLDSRHGASVGDLDAKRISVSDLETRLATQTRRADDAERQSTERRAELVVERQRVAEIAKILVSEQERGLVLEQRVAALAASSALSPSGEPGVSQSVLDILQADKAAMERALGAAYAERTRLESEVEAMRRRADKTADEMRVENAELRRRIDEVADDILRVAQTNGTGVAKEPLSASAG